MDPSRTGGLTSLSGEGRRGFARPALLAIRAAHSSGGSRRTTGVLRIICPRCPADTTSPHCGRSPRTRKKAHKRRPPKEKASSPRDPKVVKVKAGKPVR